MVETYTRLAQGAKSEIVFSTEDHKTLGYIWQSVGIWLARPFRSDLPSMHDTREAAIASLVQER